MSNAPAVPSPLPMLRLLRTGDWSPDQVATAWAPSSLDVPPAARQVIDDAWERATLEPNRKLFDGPMCRMESWDFSGGRVRVGVSRTSYKHFWGTNLMHPELADRFSPAVLANPIGVSPALETADGFLLLGRRNREVAYYPSRVHPFAGGLEPGDASAGDAPDLFAAIRRELAEELHLTDADVEIVRLTGLAEDVRLRQPELIFRVKSRLGRNRIESQLDDAEHLATVAIPADPGEVRRAVGRPELTPVAVAALLLWGRIAFGGEWFAAAAREANVVVEAAS
jgi:8-oxo-dGTP pyrophosphatase MutT (NUDIX family)